MLVVIVHFINFFLLSSFIIFCQLMGGFLIAPFIKTFFFNIVSSNLSWYTVCFRNGRRKSNLPSEYGSFIQANSKGDTYCHIPSDDFTQPDLYLSSLVRINLILFASHVVGIKPFLHRGVSNIKWYHHSNLLSDFTYVFQAST